MSRPRRHGRSCIVFSKLRACRKAFKKAAPVRHALCTMFRVFSDTPNQCLNLCQGLCKGSGSVRSVLMKTWLCQFPTNGTQHNIDFNGIGFNGRDLMLTLLCGVSSVAVGLHLASRNSACWLAGR